MYVTELQELRSVEAQLIDALPKMAGVANHPELKQAIQSHLEETHSQRDRLDEVLRRPDFRTIADFRKRHLAALSERRIRAYLPPGRARHGEADAAGHRRLTK